MSSLIANKVKTNMRLDSAKLFIVHIILQVTASNLYHVYENNCNNNYSFVRSLILYAYNLFASHTLFISLFIQLFVILLTTFL